MFKGRKIISGVLVLLLTVGFVLNVGATDAKDKANSLQQQQNQVQAEQKSLKTRLQELSASMQQLETDLDSMETEIEDIEQELIMAKIEQNMQYESMKIRIQYMYENGNTNALQYLFEANNIADFLGKAEYVSTMSAYDRKKLGEYEQTLLDVQEKEASLQAEYKNLEKLRASLSAQKEEVEALLAEKTAELKNISSELDTIKAQITRAEEEKRKQEEANNSNSSSGTTVKPKPPVISGNKFFTHPCPQMSYQSSYFGEVRTGIGDPTPHKGHDYAAPKGTPIYAAAAGTVLIARYSNSAGNWVVIDHGNGLVTKYMHMCEAPYVSAGQKVEKGQHIGGVGTTGQSTGNHLHFQVELNGVPVNPSNYM